MILSLSVSLSVCFVTTNLIEATSGDLPMEIQCDPNEDENCNVIEASMNESSTAKETTDSDQTRPSESIKIDQDEILSEEEEEEEEASDGKTPPTQTVEDSTYDLSISFSDITFEKSGRMIMYSYVNGRLPYMNGNTNSFNVRETPTNVDRETQTHFDLPQTNYTMRDFPVDEHLSIMIGGYIKHPQCNTHPNFVFPIDQRVYAANADKNQLLEFQKSLIPKDKITCFIHKSLDIPMGSIVSHEVMGYINELYDPLTFPNNEVQVIKSSIDTGPPDFKVSFKMKVTPQYAIGPSE